MKNKVFVIIILLAAVLSVTNIIFPCILPYEPMLSEERYKNKPILSDDEINELRKVYKRNNDGLAPLPNHQIVNSKNPDRRRITSNDSYVYFEVLSKPTLEAKILRSIVVTSHCCILSEAVLTTKANKK